MSPEAALLKIIQATERMIVAEYWEDIKPTPSPHMWWLELREAVEAGKDALGIE